MGYGVAFSYLQCQHPKWIRVLVPAATLAIQLPDDMSEKAEEMAQAWLPTTHVGNPEESLGCWLLPGPASTVLAIWGADGRSLTLLLSF